MNLLVLILPYIGLILLFWIVSRVAVSEADNGRTASEQGSGRIEFVPNRRNYWGVYLLIALMSYPVLMAVTVGIKSSGELWTAAFCITFILLLLIGFPGSIAATDEGLEQTYWLGRRKRIAWKDVTKINVDEKRNKVTITGAHGARIIHIRQLPDKARLFAELQTHCPDKMPAEVGQKVVTGVQS